MKILVDADACPAVRDVESLARQYSVPVMLLCDTNHVLSSDYSEIRVIGAGADAVDFALINLCGGGDVVVTQDYGVAAMALSKKAYAIHHNGMRYTDENIGSMLNRRYLAQKERRATGKNHLKGPKKRTSEDEKYFREAFEKLLREALGLPKKG